MSSTSIRARNARTNGRSVFQVQIWQFAVLVAFVAVAIVDIQGHGRREPVLLALAAVGYAGFGLLCWLAWHGLRRFQGCLGTLSLTAVYVALMGTVFLAAVVVYLVVEYAYLTGGSF